MRIECKVHGFATGRELRQRCDRSLRLALGRLQTAIERVSVTLEDAPDARDAHCRVRARLCVGGDPVLGEARDPDPLTAVDRAADRVRRGIRRRLELSREPRWD
ncbi:MAG: HPF/RaiA family ribosome-associated protein [Planctomycetota bacterium]